MGRSIPISPKHGVNATIPICFWCGKQRNEIALLGKISAKKTVRTAWGTTATEVEHDVKAPMHMVIDYNPCDECATTWETKGVVLLEVQDHPREDGLPPIQTKPYYVYPTGRWCVIQPEAACRMFNGDFKTGQRLLVDSRVYSDLMARNQQLSQQTED